MKARTHLQLTQEQTVLMTKEYNKLFKQAEIQLTEHKTYLRTLLLTRMTNELWEKVWHVDLGIDSETESVVWNVATYRNHIINDVDNLKIASIQAEPHVRDVHGEATLSVIYSYPDALYMLLRHVHTPAELRNTLLGGIDLDQEAIKKEA